MPIIARKSVLAPTEGSIGPVPRLCALVRENLISEWGCAIKLDGSRSRVFVKDVLPYGAADRAGIKVNDRILEIEHISVAGLNKMEILERLKGVKTLRLVLLVIEGETELFHAFDCSQKFHSRLSAMK